MMTEENIKTLAKPAFITDYNVLADYLGKKIYVIQLLATMNNKFYPVFKTFEGELRADHLGYYMPLDHKLLRISGVGKIHFGIKIFVDEKDYLDYLIAFKRDEVGRLTHGLISAQEYLNQVLERKKKLED